MPEVSRDAYLAADLVRQAGALAASMRRGELNISTKSGVTDLVTAADHAAERLITEALRAARPNDSIMGEEGAHHEGSSGRTWVIDPVDGTYNFASGLTHWCSALALTDADKTLVGAIYQPTSDELWLGGHGMASTLNGAPLEPIADTDADQTCLATYLHPPAMRRDDLRDSWLRIVETSGTVRQLGSSSIELASLATGRFGLWAQQSVKPWDWLPGQAIVHGAGGVTQVVSHQGYDWYLAGSQSAVAQAAQALTTTS
jgi:myo-inositol-1(or 4)-monophosphatase